MKIYKEKGYWYLESKGMVYRSVSLEYIIGYAYRVMLRMKYSRDLSFL